MARTIYKLALTQAGLDASPTYDYNFAHVIIAAHRAEARTLASAAHADEPALVWERNETSKLTAIGVAHGATKSSIVLTARING
jgi:hypothetical protein